MIKVLSLQRILLPQRWFRTSTLKPDKTVEQTPPLLPPKSAKRQVGKIKNTHERMSNPVCKNLTTLKVLIQ